MSLADDLELAAKTLRTTATKYTTLSSSFQKQTRGLSGLVNGLVTGPDRWAGLSSNAFQTSWSRTTQDSFHVWFALSTAANHLNTLASTLEAQAPIIRSSQSIQQSASSMPNATPQEVQDVHNMVQQAIQAEQSALNTIAMMVSQMSEQLGEAAKELGFCSTGDNKKNSPWENPFAASNSDSGSSDSGSSDGSSDSSPETTPDGVPLTSHATESLKRHGVTPAQADDVINNYSTKGEQADGSTVYIKKQPGGGRKYSIVIVGDNGIVTGMRDLSPHELNNLARNNGWIGWPWY